MNKLLIIIGPTASGKTDLALNLARKFNGELIACDSRQVYTGLDIGTGKLPAGDVVVKKHQGVWGIQGINIWLYDLVDPKEQFNGFDWALEAEKVIKEILKRGKLPIIVGGTGLYLKALLEGLDKLPSNRELRAELEKLTLEELQNRVVVHSPARWQKLNQSDRSNPRRLIRILEQLSMYPYTGKFPISNFQFPNYDISKIGLTAPRPFLNSKIDQRALDWFDQGILAEVQNLIDRGVPKERFKEFGLEYSLIADYLEGKISSQDELINLIQTKIRQYAKRQMTWFKREKDINWFDITDQTCSYRIEELVQNWYNQEQVPSFQEPSTKQMTKSKY